MATKMAPYHGPYGANLTWSTALSVRQDVSLKMLFVASYVPITFN